MKLNDNHRDTLAIDIGNSGTKMLYGNEYLYLDYSTNWIMAIETFLDKKSIRAAGVSYVKENVYLQIKEILEDLCVNNIVDINRELYNQRIINFDNIKGIGSDRLLSMIAGLDYCNPPLITADCGTAVTVNALAKGNIVIGGVIFAGLYTQNYSLAKGTEQLYEVEFSTIDHTCGNNTTKALNNGMLLSVAGGIRETCERIIREEFLYDDPAILLTGGYSDLIYEGLKDWDRELILDKQLVLKGILRLMR
ncbi:MAG: type III pantothenate kinase, partial [Bacteroidota bacterium]